jgi:hypothetical protein
MIDYMNDHYGDKYIFKYSTPSEYVKEVNSIDRSWPIKSDDLFPLGDYYDSWWTGYFSSRPNGKSQVRAGSHHLHASAQLRAQSMI